LSGSENERNEINQIDQINEIDCFWIAPSSPHTAIDLADLEK
jgi:hypothetical protein